MCGISSCTARQYCKLLIQKHRKKDKLCSGTTLGVEHGVRNAETDESGKQRLLHVGILLEGTVLDNRRELIVISDHDPALQARTTVFRILEMGSVVDFFRKQNVYLPHRELAVVALQVFYNQKTIFRISS